MKKIQRKYTYTYQIATETDPGKYEVIDSYANLHGDMLAMRLCNKLQRNDPEHKYVVIRIPKLMVEYRYEEE